MVNLSIIIVSYNTKEVTDDCLRSIYAAEWRRPFEVIVVDNNSHDGSAEMIREKYPQVKLIANDSNTLFAKANNQGAEIAEGKYLMLLNSDTLVWDDNLERMTEYFDTLPEDVICIGPRVLNEDRTLQSCGFANPGYRERFMMAFRVFRVLPEWMTRVVVKGLPYDKSRECGWVVGAAMMVRAGAYSEVGGLNENLIFYGEEAEFGWRTSKKGYRTIYWNQAEICHLGGVSSKKTQKERKSRQKSHAEYAAIQRETVGFRKAIRMSQLVCVSIRLKMLFPSVRQYFKDALENEHEVIDYLRECEKAERGDLAQGQKGRKGQGDTECPF